MQTRFAGTWVCPKRPDQEAARLDIKVQSPAGDQAFTVGSWDGENKEQIGFASQYGNTAKSIIQTRTEGMLGVTGEAHAFHATWPCTTESCSLSTSKLTGAGHGLR